MPRHSLHLAQADPELWAAIVGENARQESHIELIASENYVSLAILEAQGSQLTNKYAEGYPGKRYYGGCEFVDIVEQLAIDRAKEVFGAAAANVQPHSGAQANQAVFFAALKPGDTILGMSLPHGGHLTHGSPVNISGKWFNVVPYGLDRESELIDYDEVERLAHEHKPKLIIAGASAYSRVIDWKRFRAIADGVDALLMVDMAHYAGLIAADIYPSPVGCADFVTSTTHKTLRGPRGGFVLMTGAHEKAINSAVFPGLQGGPLMHVIAAKAAAFGEALSRDFRRYQEQTLENARVLAKVMQERGLRIVSGGTDCHMFLRRPPGEEDHRQGCRGGARQGADHGQQECDPQRSGKAVRHVWNPRRQPRDHDPRLHRDRKRGARASRRRRPRRAARRARRSPRSPPAWPRSTASFRSTFTAWRTRRSHEMSVLRQRRHAGDRFARVRAGRLDPPPPPLRRMPEAVHDLRDRRAAAAAGRQDQRHALRFRRRQAAQRFPARACTSARCRPNSSTRQSIAIVGQVLALGEREMPSRQVGEMVMQELYKLDKVAYIRFASVYRSFQDVEDFREAVRKIKKR